MENTVTNRKGNKVTSSSDCPTDEQVDGNSSSAATFPSAGVTSTSDDIESSNLVFEQCTGNGFVTSESASGMLSHESFGSLVPQEEQEAEDGDSSLSPLAWVHRQMSLGTDPRLILAELLPKGAFVPLNVNNSLLWRFIINLLSEPKRTKLDHINTLDDATRLLRTCKNVIVLTGAGVSVSCGIPDFRSRNGIYARLSKDYPDLPDPQAMFDIRYFRRDPRPFFKFAKEIYPGQFSPSPSHKFIKLLERQNKLLRNYSQNIDTLEHAAGIKNVITCHGSFATATCTICGYKVDSSVIKDDIFCQRIPHCLVCPAEGSEERGIMKPDIVFFGEGLSDAFHEAMAVDKEVCDLLIVMGSSLKVRPVAMIPSSIPTNVPQILINREPLKHLTFDIELLGDCDVVIGELCRRLSSDWCMDDEQIQSPPLREIAVHPKGQAGATGAEVNNNGSPGSSHSSCPPPSEESNSCDCRGMSQIRLEDSQDGLWDEDTPKRIPEGSYLFFSPSRYVFEGAEVDEDEGDDDGPCSTPTDYSTDDDAAKEPADKPSPCPEETKTGHPLEEKSWEGTK